MVEEDQGAVTAANLIVQAAFLEGKYGSAFTLLLEQKEEELLLMVMQGAVRIDDKPINIQNR
jgi:Pyruvate/2-oxoacid:ferredoxin oxidoreductase gamma subunit